MKNLFTICGILVGIAALSLAAVLSFTPWMDRSEAPGLEIAAQNSGSELEATPTPEVFNPLEPSPTRSTDPLPLTCQVTDLNVYINETWGYCFAYPDGFSLDDTLASNETVSLYGPELDNSSDAVRVTFGVTSQTVPEGSDLARLVDAYLSSSTFLNLPWTISRQSVLLAGGTAELLEPVPGRTSIRLVLALHSNVLYTLSFQPTDVELARSDLETLYQTVTGSFAFLSAAEVPGPQKRSVNWYEFGQNLTLTYDGSLAPWVEAATIPAVPFSDTILFAESHPAYAQFRFLGFQGGRLYDLPLLPFENRMAQVMIFQTADFAGYGDEHPLGFNAQRQALAAYLNTASPDFTRCAQPFTGSEQSLPVLPWLYAQQAFCAQPAVVEFNGGTGIRYLTYYSQDPSPIMDSQIFYTFQGLTTDGQFYVAAYFPVATGIFPNEPPPCPQCSEPDYNPFTEWTQVVSLQLNQLNGLEPDRFSPALNVLDETIGTIKIGN
jgi:hypothetical protein